MNSTTKNLTLASILTSLCVVITIFALSTGIGYGIYLDFAIPIFFAIVYLKCGGKYSILSGIVSITCIYGSWRSCWCLIYEPKFFTWDSMCLFYE